MVYGYMDIENVFCGFVVFQLRFLIDNVVKILFDVKKNNNLVEIVFGMLKNIKIVDKMDKIELVEIKVQVCYVNLIKGNFGK